MANYTNDGGKPPIMPNPYPEDPNRETVTEEMHPENAWFEEARKMTIENLPNFIERIIHGYNHDYGTACHAVSACAVATAWATCGDENIGLSGFQAGFVMWDFIRQWMYMYNECGMKLIDYDNFLYPQYAEKMDKTINKSTWEQLQKRAKELIATDNDACLRVQLHWQSIVDGIVPFGYRVLDE